MIAAYRKKQVGHQQTLVYHALELLKFKVVNILWGWSYVFLGLELLKFKAVDN